jgi:hypothetical protein
MTWFPSRAAKEKGIPYEQYRAKRLKGYRQRG